MYITKLMAKDTIIKLFLERKLRITLHRDLGGINGECITYRVNGEIERFEIKLLMRRDLRKVVGTLTHELYHVLQEYFLDANPLGLCPADGIEYAEAAVFAQELYAPEQRRHEYYAELASVRLQRKLGVKYDA